MRVPRSFIAEVFRQADAIGSRPDLDMPRHCFICGGSVSVRELPKSRTTSIVADHASDCPMPELGRALCRLSNWGVPDVPPP